MTETIKIGVIGAAGRMGNEICRFIQNVPEIIPFCALDESEIGKDWGLISGIDANGIEIIADLDRFLTLKPDVVIDVSVGSAVAINIPQVLKAGCRTVIGATGIPNESIDEFETIATDNGICCLIVPNFSISANLMVEMARNAAPFFTNVEVIERHHTGKKDAPSGTSLFTVSEIAISNPNISSQVTEHELISGSRGGILDGIRIHSIRLPGVLAEQTVIFGSPGETIEITHRSISRECFMQGVVLSIHYVLKAAPGVIIGLDQILADIKQG